MWLSLLQDGIWNQTLKGLEYNLKRSIPRFAYCSRAFMTRYQVTFTYVQISHTLDISQWWVIFSQKVYFKTFTCLLEKGEVCSYIKLPSIYWCYHYVKLRAKTRTHHIVSNSHNCPITLALLLTLVFRWRNWILDTVLNSLGQAPGSDRAGIWI